MRLEFIFGPPVDEGLVRRLEEIAGRHPRLFALRAALLVLSAYALLAFLLVGCLWGMVWATVWALREAQFMFLGLVAGMWVLAGVIVRSVWVPLSHPEGNPVAPGEAPQLFVEIEELRRRWRVPRIQHVLLTFDCNASMAQLPAFGIFGWHRSYLLLGIPLLLGLSAQHFRAVLAHELAHYSGNHGRFQSWFYRVEQTWARIEDEMKWNPSLGGVLLLWFFRWYLPRLHAYFYVLSRTHERDAERIAADAVGRLPVGEALVQVSLLDRFLTDKVWPVIWRDADERTEMPADIVARLAETMVQGWSESEARQWLHDAIKEETRPGYTHPSLRERLAGLGLAVEGFAEGATETVRVPLAVRRNAAEELLGGIESLPLRRASDSWRAKYHSDWRSRFEQADATRRRLAELDRCPESELTREDRWELILGKMRFEGERAMVPLLREFIVRYPDHLDAWRLLGHSLLADGDPEGIEWLEKVMQANPDDLFLCGATVAEYLERQGRKEQAEQYREEYQTKFDRYVKAEAERKQILPEDLFLPHGLPSEQVGVIRSRLAEQPEVESAYLVRKRLEHSPQPLFVLGVVLDRPARAKGLLAQVEWYDRIAGLRELPEQTRVVILGDGQRKLRKAVADTPRSVIYERDSFRPPQS